nr:pyocin activator PrtN family protein [Klebsiella quasipneumoniae]
MRRLRFSGPRTSIIRTPTTSLKTSIKTITNLSDTSCLEIHGASLPTFRAAESQKAPRMIHIQDLANHIDAQLKKGRDLLEQMKGDSK